MAKIPEKEEFDGYPSQDNTPRFLEDQLLRGFAFEIVSRRNNEPPIWKWKQNGKSYTHSGALRIVKRLKKEAEQQMLD